MTKPSAINDAHYALPRVDCCFTMTYTYLLMEVLSLWWMEFTPHMPCMYISLSLISLAAGRPQVIASLVMAWSIGLFYVTTSFTSTSKVDDRGFCLIYHIPNKIAQKVWLELLNAFARKRLSCFYSNKSISGIGFFRRTASWRSLCSSWCRLWFWCIATSELLLPFTKELPRCKLVHFCMMCIAHSENLSANFIFSRLHASVAGWYHGGSAQLSQAKTKERQMATRQKEHHQDFGNCGILLRVLLVLESNLLHDD